MLHKLVFMVFLISKLNKFANGELCDKLYGSEESFVCICKDVDCDTLGKIDPPSEGNYLLMSSSRDELRFSLSQNVLDVNSTTNETSSNTASIYVNHSRKKQSMIGFGGAFTDASGLNIATLETSMQQTLISHYFGPEGIEYNVGRVPIAGTDFSTRPYSYDDIDGDTVLQYFNLTAEDHLYKIPYIKMAQSVSERNLVLFASPWAPPYWMKTNGMVNGSGSLLPEMQQPWANYFIKFFEAYEQENISFWGLTTQNEPTQGLITNHPWNACGYTADYMMQFVRDYLGPTLQSSSYSDLQVMVTDDSREALPWFPETILNDSVASSYVQGIAVHWYADKVVPPSVLTDVHLRSPEKFILYTEACHEPVLLQHGSAVKLGSWDYAEQYADNIIENSNHYSAGWVDWNLVLDIYGGPNWATNYVDSPVIVSEDGREFYKQPMFYALGHFSKFVPEGSVRLETSVEENVNKPRQGVVTSTAFLTPSNQTVVVILSKNDDTEDIVLSDSDGNFISLTIPPRSIHTIVY